MHIGTESPDRNNKNAHFCVWPLTSSAWVLFVVSLYFCRKSNQFFLSVCYYVITFEYFVTDYE